jgi:hypothetical protein
VSTTLDTYLPFDAGAGANVTEAMWRRLIGNLGQAAVAGVMRGVGAEGAVIQRAAGANASVDVGAAECRIRGHLGILAASTNVGIAANATGNPRIDRIVLRADFVNNNMVLDVLQGTAAGSPVAPALTTSSSIHEISLAQIAVASGFTSIVTGNITDERPWANAVRWFKQWAIAGTNAVPSGASNYIIPVLFELESGWSANISRSSYAIRGGTSATFKIQKSATLTGALADVTGLTGLVAAPTQAKTDLSALTGLEVPIVDQSFIVPVVTAVSASPDDLYVGVSGWRWPTPQVA